MIRNSKVLTRHKITKILIGHEAKKIGVYCKKKIVLLIPQILDKILTEYPEK